MPRRATRPASSPVAFAIIAVFLVVAVFFSFAATPADAQLDVYAQVAPELAQPDKVKTSAADAADAAVAKSAALAALDRSLPVCAKKKSDSSSSSKNASSPSSCALVRPLANDTADDPAWSQFEAAYAGTVWLPPLPAAEKMHIKAAGSYYQIAKLPLSRSACAPGSLVAARLVLRLPAANGTKFTAGLLPRVNELADSKTVRRCVLGGGVNGLSTPQEAARAAGSAVAFASGGCTECNTLSAGGPSSVSSSSSNGGYGGSESSSSSKDSDEGVKLCPSTPGVWYVDTLPLKVPTAAAGWCDDGDDEDEAAGAKKKTTATTAKAEKVRRPEQDAFAAFVVNAGSKVDVASFEIIPRGAAGGAGAQSA